MSHKRAKRVRKMMFKAGIETKSVKGRRAYQKGKQLAKEGRI